MQMFMLKHARARRYRLTHIAEQALSGVDVSTGTNYD